jgi:hypothetical protein
MRRRLLFCAALAPLVGCQTDNIYIVTSTRNAVEISAAADTSQTASIGHKRLEGVLMPARRSDGTVRDQAYSVLATYRFHQGSLLLANVGRLRIRQTFAVGKAAREKLAAASVAKLFSGEPSQKACPALEGSDEPVRKIDAALRAAKPEERKALLTRIQRELQLPTDLDADETVFALEPLRCTPEDVARLNAVAGELR